MYAARSYAASAVVIAATVAPVAAQPAATPVASVTHLSMDDAVRLALARNPSIAAQRLDVDASKADEITAGLKPNPSVSFGADGLALFSPRRLTPSFLGNDVSYSGTLDYTFERGGKRDRRMTVAADTTNVTAQNVLDAERQLRFDTRQAFINVLLAKASSDLAADNLQSFSQVVDINQQRVQAGDIAEADFYRISLQKLAFQQDVSAAAVALVQAKAALRQLVGYESVADTFDVDGTLTYAPETATLDDLKQAALATRPDLAAAERAASLARDAAALERANRARDVGGELSYTHTGPDNAIGVGVGIDLPIHDRNQGNIAHADVAVRQAEVTVAATRTAVLTDVVNAYAAFQTSRDVVELFQSGYLDQAQQSLDISRYVYQQGSGTLLDLLDAERTYRDTQVGYLQALAAYMTSVQQINLAVGKQVMP
jgi:cobalt-zinc-cadmium efflux system outer membrane protein